MAMPFRRDWWKPWNWSTRTWFLVIIALALISPLMTRWACLWQVPDIALPFKIDDVICEVVPADADAIGRYVVALRLLDNPPTESLSDKKSFQRIEDLYRAQEQALASVDRTWDDRLNQWLQNRSNSLAEYRLASEMQAAGGPSLKTASRDTAVNEHQKVPRLAKLAELEAIRLERAGEFDAAWNCLLANLRCARHCQMPRFDICHLIGNAIRSSAYRGIARWAEQPSLTKEQLQAARHELVIDLAQAVPTSELIKANYLQFKNWMEQDGGPNHLYPRWSLASPEEPQVLFGKRMLLWVVGQPEVQLRLARQLLVNNLEQIHLPLHLRRESFNLKPEFVFVRDPHDRDLPGQLAPERLRALVESQLTKMPDLQGYLIGGETMDRVNRVDAARRQTLDVVLACHLYQRLHGEFPEAMEQLVPAFLDSIPFDPKDSTGAAVRYRRETNGEAISWSVGWDAVDDGGDISTREPKDIGYRIRLD